MGPQDASTPIGRTCPRASSYAAIFGPYEQRFLWGSQSADQEASYNLAGARSPAIDAMIAAMVAAKTYEEFDDAVRAYDRVLLSGFYIVPLFYAREQWIAYSNKLAHPKTRGPPGERLKEDRRHQRVSQQGARRRPPQWAVVVETTRAPGKVQWPEWWGT